MDGAFYIVVTGTDYSEQATRVLKAAYEQAREHAPAELHVVHASLMAGPPAGPVSAPGGVTMIQSLDEQQQALVRHLDEQLAKLPGFKEAGVSIMAHVLIDAPTLAITRLADELGADLLVIGSHGRHGVARWLLGSVAEGVVRQASCPVLVIPPLPSELIPPIDATCAACQAAREESGGVEQWCAQHGERHGRRHVYHQSDRIAADSNFPLVIR